MRIRTALTGETPLVMHNIQLADPDNVWSKQIAAITSKTKKTEADRREIARLEWFGGLYVGREGPMVPTGHIRRCFQEAAKVSREGKTVTRGLISLKIEAPLAYDGPRDIKQLWELEQFRYTASVGIGNKKVMRTRPIFSDWHLDTEWEMVEDVIKDFDSLLHFVTQAGIIEGLGDNRINGYGRFSVKVTKL